MVCLPMNPTSSIQSNSTSEKYSRENIPFCGRIRTSSPQHRSSTRMLTFPLRVLNFVFQSAEASAPAYPNTPSKRCARESSTHKNGKARTLCQRDKYATVRFNPRSAKMKNKELQSSCLIHYTMAPYYYYILLHIVHIVPTKGLTKLRQPSRLNETQV